MARIIIKIGTNSLTDDSGKINYNYLVNVAEQVKNLQEKGNQIIIVSSGAIGAGTVEMGFTDKIRDIPTRQAMAAVGQGIVMRNWHDAFSEVNVKIGQILITYDDFSNRSRFLNLHNSLEVMLKMGVVPIMNENDPISVNEIGESFGDNDKMSSLIASKIEADLLILLSDIDGFYDKNPKEFNDAKKLDVVEEITNDIENMCGSTGSKFSSGGMLGKINAIKIAVASGVNVVLCNGADENVILKAVEEENIGTKFIPHKTLTQKKSWIKEAKSYGVVHIDNGACKALSEGKNLLPAGITKVEGNFDCEAIVDIKCEGNLFAKAIVDYSSDALLKMLGKKSSEIGHKVKNVIKRENLVIL